MYSLPTSTTLGTGTGHSGGSSTTTPPKSNATALVDEWARSGVTDTTALGERGMGFERLDQLALEHLYGVR